jgi:hypothetical protein
VRGPAEILATLDEHGTLQGMPFMPEMLAYLGQRFVVDKRAHKVCDTIHFYTSRAVPDAVLLEDLRCSGSGHDGCQAECRIFWKEAWLRQVRPGESRVTEPDDAAYARLEQLVGTNSKTARPASHASYRCQATELYRASQHVRTLDPRPYVRELTSGNVDFFTFLKVTARAVLIEPMRKLGFRQFGPLPNATPRPPRLPVLDLKPGELVRVKSRDQIFPTLTPDRKNRGLAFDVDEMAPFCGGTYRVRRRILRFIDDRTGNMIQMKSDAVALDGVVCSGEHSTARWFCPRAIFPYWREAWLERVDPSPTPVLPGEAPLPPNAAHSPRPEG